MQMIMFIMLILVLVVLAALRWLLSRMQKQTDESAMTQVSKSEDVNALSSDSAIKNGNAGSFFGQLAERNSEPMEIPFMDFRRTRNDEDQKPKNTKVSFREDIERSWAGSSNDIASYGTKWPVFHSNVGLGNEDGSEHLKIGPKCASFPRMPMKMKQVGREEGEHMRPSPYFHDLRRRRESKMMRDWNLDSKVTDICGDDCVD